MSVNPLKILTLYLVAMLLTVLNLDSLTSSPFSNISLPLLELMAIYYFAIYRNVFGYWFVLLLGVLGDALTGVPLGISSLIYIIVIKIFEILSQKQTPKEDFISIIKEFIIFVTSILFLKWLLLCIYHTNLYNIVPLIFQMIITSLFYVLIHHFFEFLYKKLVLQKDSAQGL